MFDVINHDFTHHDFIMLNSGHKLMLESEQYLQGVPKNAAVIFPVTTGTNTLSIWKTKTDMESSLSQLFMQYTVFILPLSNR